MRELDNVSSTKNETFSSFPPLPYTLAGENVDPSQFLVDDILTVSMKRGVISKSTNVFDASDRLLFQVERVSEFEKQLESIYAGAEPNTLSSSADTSTLEGDREWPNADLHQVRLDWRRLRSLSELATLLRNTAGFRCCVTPLLCNHESRSKEFMPHPKKNFLVRISFSVDVGLHESTSFMFFSS